MQAVWPHWSRLAFDPGFHEFGGRGLDLIAAIADDDLEPGFVGLPFMF